jgi:hypothetical protein
MNDKGCFLHTYLLIYVPRFQLLSASYIYFGGLSYYHHFVMQQTNYDMNVID